MNLNENKPKLGSGKRFAALKSKLAHKKDGPRDPGAVAAAIGRKKYGKAKFQKMAAAGRRHHESILDQLIPPPPADE